MTDKIKYVLWDIDGTLLNFELAEKAALNQCFKEFNLGTCSDTMLEYYKKINRNLWKQLELGTITKQEVLEGRFHDFFLAYNIDTSLAKNFNIAYQNQLAMQSSFNEYGKEIVQALAKRYQQYAVTNGTKVAQQGKLSRSGLDQLFDGIFISEEVGFEKPRIEFFNTVFDSINDYNKECYIIIGDSLTSDMQGGNNAAICTCLYNPSGESYTTDLQINYEIENLKDLQDILL